MARKVIDVSIQVTCLEEDAEAVKAELNEWFCRSEAALVQRPRTGGIRISAPRSLQTWMRAVLCPN